MRMMTALFIACAIWCLAIATEAAEKAAKAEIIRDVAYDHKDALQAMDVVKPQRTNGAGILCIASGAWHSCKQPPEATLVAGASYPYYGWFECRASLIRVSPFSSCGIAAVRSTSCPKSSMTCTAAFVSFAITPSGLGLIPSGWASPAVVQVGTWR